MPSSTYLKGSFLVEWSLDLLPWECDKAKAPTITSHKTDDHPARKYADNAVAIHPYVPALENTFRSHKAIC